MNRENIKKQSENIIKTLGGETLDKLPLIEPIEPRESQEVASRALAMHGMLQLSFGAPRGIISRWIKDNHLDDSLCQREKDILERDNGLLTDEDRTVLYWYVEAIWTFVWAGNIINNINIEDKVSNDLALLLPDIENGESGKKFKSIYKLRTTNEIYATLDLYYRAHWYVRDGGLKRYDTGIFYIDEIMERRKALEWIACRGIKDWDDTPDNT